MTRQNEIKEILRALLGRAHKAIDNNQYSDDIDKIVKSGEDMVVISAEMQKYLKELSELEQANFVHGDK